jgi:hypothetical protein|tara:strand:- start:7207 stop:7632 length:426 start_codon:yes stop_codon:yes gene_type:complete
MAISQAITVSFKQDLMSPGGNLEAQTLKCALYDNTATLNQNTTAYITANEVSNSGTNYTVGGATLTNVAISTDGTTAIFDADNVSFANATISAQAALIYNANNSNSSIAVLDFGGVKTSTNGTFELQFPNADATNGLIRIA